MKIDDMGFFARHAEKLALGLGLLVLIAAGMTQFAGQPNAVELNGREVAPADLEETVVREADALQAKLEGETTVNPIEIPRYTQTFQKLYALPVAGDVLRGLWDRPGLALEFTQPTDIQYVEKFLPRPPVGADIIAKSDHGVLADTGDEYFVSIRSIVGDQLPADFPYVSVTTWFPMNQWKARLEAPNATAEQRIDPALWMRRMAITAVYLLRQELDPRTGQWSEATRIDPLPGQYAIMPEDMTRRTLQDAEAWEADVRASQQQIAMPRFPEIVNGPWTPPDYQDRVLSSEELARQRELEGAINSLTRRIDRMTGSTPGQRRVPPTPSDVQPDAGRAGSSGRTGRAAQPPVDREAAQLAQLQEELFAKQRELNNLLGIDSALSEDGTPQDIYPPGAMNGDMADPEALGDGPGFGQQPTPSPRGGFGNTAAQPAGEVPDRVKVWAHDLTVEPGKTYRYKVVVAVLNPLYRQSRLPAEQVEANFHRISLGPDPTELQEADWSPPITLDPEYFFFLISGNRDQKRVEAEVWKIYNGLWRKHSFIEFPGNEIGGVANIAGIDDGGLGIRMDVGKILLDVDTVSGAGVGGRGVAIRALYLDPDSGSIHSRLVENDRNSDQRQRLMNEEKSQLTAQDQLTQRQ